MEEGVLTIHTCRKGLNYRHKKRSALLSHTANVVFVLFQMHEEKGVKFHFNTSVQEFKGSNGKVGRSYTKKFLALNSQ